MPSLVHYETLHILSSREQNLPLSDWAGTPNHRCASYEEIPSHPPRVYELQFLYRLKAGPHCLRAKGGYTLRLRSPDDKAPRDQKEDRCPLRPSCLSFIRTAKVNECTGI